MKKLLMIPLVLILFLATTYLLFVFMILAFGLDGSVELIYHTGLLNWLLTIPFVCTICTMVEIMNKTKKQ